jgi:hypothetical protein
MRGTLSNAGRQGKPSRLLLVIAEQYADAQLADDLNE